MKKNNSGKRNRKKIVGLFLIIAPIVGLFLILLTWSVVSFVIGQMIVAGPSSAGMDNRMVIGNIINVALGFLGILCVLGIMIGLPVGIVLVLTGKKDAPSEDTARESLPKSN